MVRASTLSTAFLALAFFPGLSGALRNVVAMTGLPVSWEDWDAAAADIPGTNAMLPVRTAKVGQPNIRLS
jgi:hypothetical protein